MYHKMKEVKGMKTEERQILTIHVNGQTYELEVGKRPGQVASGDTLAHVLRDVLGLTGTKTPCNRGECGACTVIIDGKAVLSCSTLALDCEDRQITTIEGVADPVTGELHPIQQAFLDVDAIQCGMCTPGFVMASKALLDQNDNPDEREVREALAGNLCRCTGYEKYIDGVMLAAERIRGSKEGQGR